MTRTANEFLGRSTRGRPKPWVKVTRRVDPVMTELRERRLALGMTQDDLAALVGISGFTISAAEQGRVSPTLRTLRDWSQALGYHRIRLEEME